MFKIQGHRIFFQVWQKPLIGTAFAATATILWLAFWLGRPRYVLLSRRFRTLLWAYYFSGCTVSLLLINSLAAALKEQTFVAPFWIMMIGALAAGVWLAYLLKGKEQQEHAEKDKK